MARQYLHVLKAMWDVVDDHYDPKKILTPGGHALVQTHAIKAAHPHLPCALHFLAMMCALANGAKSQWFPNAASPLFIMFINVNYAQTRKSSLTGNADAFGDLLDKFVRTVADDIWNTTMRAEHEAAERKGVPKTNRPKPVVISSVLHSATAEEFWHRCSGDFCQVANATKLSSKRSALD